MKLPPFEYSVKVEQDRTVKYVFGGVAYQYISSRYGKMVTVPAFYPSDGATHAITRPESLSHWVHDVICERATWDDGTPVNALQAAFVLSDILEAEAKLKRSYHKWFGATLSMITSRAWFVATYLFGCVKTRKNGWW